MLCCRAEHLAPIGASNLNAMTLALAPHLQQGIAYRQGVSETNYESFVKEVQSLAKGLEFIPSFRTIRGSYKEYYTSENNPQVFQLACKVKPPAS